jgi:hypothetical protein
MIVPTVVILAKFACRGFDFLFELALALMPLLVAAMFLVAVAALFIAAAPPGLEFSPIMRLALRFLRARASIPFAIINREILAHTDTNLAHRTLIVPSLMDAYLMTS